MMVYPSILNRSRSEMRGIPVCQSQLSATQDKIEQQQNYDSFNWGKNTVSL